MIASHAVEDALLDLYESGLSLMRLAKIADCRVSDLRLVLVSASNRRNPAPVTVPRPKWHPLPYGSIAEVADWYVP